MAIGLSAVVAAGVVLPAQAADPQLTMKGYGPVGLRMTIEQAVATGWVKRGLGVCFGEKADFRRKYHARGLFDVSNRLVYIQAQRAVRGIRVGTPMRTVRARFPDLAPVGRNVYTRGRILAHRGPTSSLQFTAGRGRVATIILTTGFVGTGVDGEC